MHSWNFPQFMEFTLEKNIFHAESTRHEQKGQAPVNAQWLIEFYVVTDNEGMSHRSMEYKKFYYHIFDQ